MPIRNEWQNYILAMLCEDGKLLSARMGILFILSYADVDLFNCIYVSVLPLISARTHLLRMCICMKKITLFIHFPSHNFVYIAFLISSGVCAWLSSTNSDISITLQFKARDRSKRFLIRI